MPDIGLKELIGLLIAGAAALTAVRVWLKSIHPFFQRIRRLITEWEAAQVVIAAQLKKNNGGSLIDRVDAVHSALFSEGRSAMPALIAEIREAQVEGRDRFSEFMGTNSAQHDENIHSINTLSSRVQRLELHQQWNETIWTVAMPMLPEEVQVALSTALELHPKPQDVSP